MIVSIPLAALNRILFESDEELRAQFWEKMVMKMAEEHGIDLDDDDDDGEEWWQN